MNKNVSLVLSGGGARGLAHIGVIEELEQQGFNITSVAGTSMGAVVGGVYAVGKLEEFKKWMCSLDTWDVLKLIDFTLNSQGFIKGDRVFKKMKAFIPDTKIEDLKIHYSAVATDINTKKEVVFTQGSIYEAIRASVAIPTVITPIKTKKKILVDGGIINDIPLEHVKRTKKDLLIAVYVNADTPAPKFHLPEKKEASTYLKKLKQFQKDLEKIYKKKTKENLGYFDLINETISLLTYQVSKMRIEKYPPDILINISEKAAGFFDFYEAKRLVDIGKKETAKTLKKVF